MVTTRKAIELTYNGLCTVIEYQRVKKENGSTGFVEAIILENQPCRLSYSRLSSVGDGGIGFTITQGIKIFIAPEIIIKVGSKLVITQNNITTEYQSSGQPAIYKSHQEIVIELFRGWA